jgi:hypothetical protein
VKKEYDKKEIELLQAEKVLREKDIALCKRVAELEMTVALQVFVGRDLLFEYHFQRGVPLSSFQYSTLSCVPQLTSRMQENGIADITSQRDNTMQELLKAQTTINKSAYLIQVRFKMN